MLRLRGVSIHEPIEMSNYLFPDRPPVHEVSAPIQNGLK